LAAARGNPRILAFVCSWHPLTAADNAGADGRSYGTGTTIVPVDCAGAVSGAAILKAFSGKIDGVLVAACGRGDCHYTNGNESCESVLKETRELLRLAGVAPERLRLDLSSDVDGGRFVELLEEFSAELSGLNGAAKKRQGAAKKKAKKPAPKKTTRSARKAAPKKTGKKATAERAAPKRTRKKAKARKTAAKKGANAPRKKAKTTAPKKTRSTKKTTPKKTGTRSGRK
jgi:coenzyme F420-reducing hydrogenase delta subunit